MPEELTGELRFGSIRYPDPTIRVNDTVKIDLATGKIQDFIRFDTGVIAMATGGRNMGRVGVITHRERHDGGFNIIHIKDAIDNEFATRESNVFVIGKSKPWISLPKGKGVKVRAFTRLSIVVRCGRANHCFVVAIHCRGERSPSGFRSGSRLKDEAGDGSRVSARDRGLEAARRLLALYLQGAQTSQTLIQRPTRSELVHHVYPRRLHPLPSR